MKKNLLFLFAAALGMLATSCSNDEQLEGQNGKEQMVTLDAQLENGLLTRAFGDGTTATKLYYAVYEQGTTTPLAVCQDGADKTRGEKDINMSTTVTLKLTTGKNYDVLFWAASDGAPYSFDQATQEVTVDYDAMKANAESTDAFFAKKSFTVGTTTRSVGVELRRPFAQLNIGTKDIQDAVATGFNVADAKSQITVKGLCGKLNLATGAVTEAADRTFALNAIPAGETYPKEGYEYLNMDYLLVPSYKSLVDVAFSVEDGVSPAIERTFTNVPVQRNYRTNIYGSLLTKTTDFNVELKPAFQGDYEGYTVSNTEELEQLLYNNDESDIVVNVKGSVNFSSQDPYLMLGTQNTRSITIQGVDANAKITFTTNYWSRIRMANPDATLKFKDIQLTSEQQRGTWDSYDLGFWDGNFEFENVRFLKSIYFNRASKYTHAKMTGCSISESHDYYAIWMTSGAELEMDNCTISAPNGRCVKISEQYVTNPETLRAKLVSNNCKYVSKSKAAIYVGSRGGADITFTGTNDISGVQADTENHVWVEAGYDADNVTVTGGNKLAQ